MAGEIITKGPTLIFLGVVSLLQIDSWAIRQLYLHLRSRCATASQVCVQLLHKSVCNYFTSRCATASQAAIGHPDHLNLDSLIVLAFVSAFDLLPSSNLQDDESDRVLVHASMHLTTKLLEEWPRAGLVQVSKPPSQQNL